MSEVIDKNLVLFWGWNRNEKSYQGLIDVAPEGWNIYHISYPELIPNGRLDKLQENVLKFLAENGLDQAYLLGHSLGGALALEFAYHHANKVKGLFLIDSEGVYDGNSSLKSLFNVALHSRMLTGGMKDNLRDLFRSLRNPILHAKLGHLAHHLDVTDEASKLAVPTTIMWGDADRIVSIDQGQRLHYLIKGSKLVILKGQGHDWILNSPELFWQNI